MARRIASVRASVVDGQTQHLLRPAAARNGGQQLLAEFRRPASLPCCPCLFLLWLGFLLFFPTHFIRRPVESAAFADDRLRPAVRPAVRPAGDWMGVPPLLLCALPVLAPVPPPRRAVLVCFPRHVLTPRTDRTMDDRRIWRDRQWTSAVMSQ